MDTVKIPLIFSIPFVYLLKIVMALLGIPELSKPHLYSIQLISFQSHVSLNTVVILNFGIASKNWFYMQCLYNRNE